MNRIDGPFPVFGTRLLHVRDEKASGVASVAGVGATWNTRVLNTVKVNEIAGAALAANRVSLLAGSYYVQGIGCADNVSGNKLRVRDITGAADLLVGVSVDGPGATEHPSIAHIQGRIELLVDSDIELQHYTTVGKAFGTATGAGVVEVYAELMIWRIE